MEPLCYCYSGFSGLMSRMIRSEEVKSKMHSPAVLAPIRFIGTKTPSNNDRRTGYASPKDMCTGRYPAGEINKAGVYSRKIEGRMKKPEIHRRCGSSVYRKYSDVASSGEKHDRHWQEDKQMPDIYNRMVFTRAIGYKQRNGFKSKDGNSEMKSAGDLSEMKNYLPEYGKNI